MKKVKLFCSDEYEVDDEGNVYSKNGNILKYSINTKGHCIINLMINGERKGMHVHTAVMKSFCPTDDPTLQVNHKNGIKTDNRLENLEWVTAKENVRHAIKVLGYDKKYKGQLIKGIHTEAGEEVIFPSHQEAAEALGCNKSRIGNVISGRKKSCKGYKFYKIDESGNIIS